jgi:hypothetical protein
LREQICDRKTHDSAPIPKTQPDPIRYFLTAKSNLREPHFAQFNVYKEKHLSLFAVKSKKFDDDFISWWNDILNQNLDQLDQFLFIKMKNFFNTYDNSFFSIRHCQLQVNAILTFLEGKPNAAAILKCLKEKREEVRTPEFNQNGRYCRMLDFIIGKLTNLNCLKSQLPQFNEFLARR